MLNGGTMRARVGEGGAVKSGRYIRPRNAMMVEGTPWKKTNAMVNEDYVGMDRSRKRPRMKL